MSGQIVEHKIGPYSMDVLKDQRNFEPHNMDNCDSSPLSTEEPASQTKESSLSVSLCGQLGVKKNFLKRACGEDWNLDRYHQQDLSISEPKSKITKTISSEAPEVERVTNTDWAQGFSDARIVNALDLNKDKHCSFSVIPIIRRKNVTENTNKDNEVNDITSSKSVKRSIISSNSPIKQENNNCKRSADQATPSKVSQCYNILNDSFSLRVSSPAMRSRLTPQKNQTNSNHTPGGSITRALRTLTPILSKRFENGCYSEGKNVDHHISSLKGSSVKRRIFSHNDKENRPPNQESLPPVQIPSSRVKTKPDISAMDCTNSDIFGDPSKEKQILEQSDDKVSVAIPAPSSCPVAVQTIEKNDDRLAHTVTNHVTADFFSSCFKSVPPTTSLISHPDKANPKASCVTTPASWRSVVAFKPTCAITSSSSILPRHHPYPLQPSQNSNTISLKFTTNHTLPSVPVKQCASNHEHATSQKRKHYHEGETKAPTGHLKSQSQTTCSSDISLTIEAPRETVVVTNSQQLPAESGQRQQPSSKMAHHPHHTAPYMAPSSSSVPYVYPSIFSSPPGNLPPESILQFQLAAASHFASAPPGRTHNFTSPLVTASTAAAVVATATSSSLASLRPPVYPNHQQHIHGSPYNMMSMAFNQTRTPVPIYSMASAGYPFQFLSPYIPSTIRPSYASTPSTSATSTEDVKPRLENLQLLSEMAESQITPQQMALMAEARQQQSQLSHPAIQNLHHSRPSPESSTHIVPSMNPYFFPTILTPMESTHHPRHIVQSGESTRSDEQSLPLDLSSMRPRHEATNPESRDNPCRKTLFPQSLPDSAMMAELKMRLGRESFNSSGDSAYKSDETDRQSPDYPGPSTHQPSTSAAAADTAALTEADSERSKGEKNPFGIHKILGVQESPSTSTVQPAGNQLAERPEYSQQLSSKHEPEGRLQSRPLKRHLSSCDDEPEPKKKCRDKPPPWGIEMPNIPVLFEDSEERDRFCDENLLYEAPLMPTNHDRQKEMKSALLRLFEKSNLPPVPKKMRNNLIALRYFPHMKNLFQAQLHTDTSTLNISPGGLAFQNFKMEEDNAVIDKMLRKEGDVFHCLGRKCIDPDDAVCHFTAKTLGKMRRHVKNHLPDKKWVCCFCRHQMTDQTDMSRHGTTHTQLRPFYCDPCGKSFTQKVTLVGHLRTNHSIIVQPESSRNRFTCRPCGDHFRQHQREECIEHLLTYHKDDLYITLKKKNKFPFNADDEQ